MKNLEHFDAFLRDVVNINQSRLDRLNGHVKAVTEYLSQKLDSYRKVERQGSYALRTIVKPVEDREYDADVLLFMKYDRAKKPAEYIDAVYHCLKQNGNYADKVHRRTRCVYIDYAGDFHLDIVPCIEVNGRHFICNNKTNEFEETDGTGYRDWFNAKTQNYQRQLEEGYQVAEIYAGPQGQLHRAVNSLDYPDWQQRVRW